MQPRLSEYFAWSLAVREIEVTLYTHIPNYQIAFPGQKYKPDKLTDSNGFQQVPVTAVIEAESFEPKYTTESDAAPPTLDLRDSDFIASESGELIRSPTPIETEKILHTDPIHNTPTGLIAGDEEL